MSFTDFAHSDCNNGLECLPSLLFEIPQIGDSVVKIDFTARRIHSFLSSKTFTESEEGLNMVMALTANDQNLAIFLLTIIFFPLQIYYG